MLDGANDPQRTGTNKGSCPLMHGLGGLSLQVPLDRSILILMNFRDSLESTINDPHTGETLQPVITAEQVQAYAQEAQASRRAALAVTSAVDSPEPRVFYAECSMQVRRRLFGYSIDV